MNSDTPVPIPDIPVLVPDIPVPVPDTPSVPVPDDASVLGAKRARIDTAPVTRQHDNGDDRLTGPQEVLVAQIGVITYITANIAHISRSHTQQVLLMNPRHINSMRRRQRTERIPPPDYVGLHAAAIIFGRTDLFDLLLSMDGAKSAKTSWIPIRDIGLLRVYSHADTMGNIDKTVFRAYAAEHLKVFRYPPRFVVDRLLDFPVHKMWMLEAICEAVDDACLSRAWFATNILYTALRSVATDTACLAICKIAVANNADLSRRLESSRGSMPDAHLHASTNGLHLTAAYLEEQMRIQQILPPITTPVPTHIVNP
jgi:hypothetical protein